MGEWRAISNITCFFTYLEIERNLDSPQEFCPVPQDQGSMGHISLSTSGCAVVKDIGIFS